MGIFKKTRLGLNSFLTPKNYPIFVKINLLLSSCPSSDSAYFKQGISFSTKLTNHFYLNARGSVGEVLGKSDGEPAHNHMCTKPPGDSEVNLLESLSQHE